MNKQFKEDAQAAAYAIELGQMLLPYGYRIGRSHHSPKGENFRYALHAPEPWASCDDWNAYLTDLARGLSREPIPDRDGSTSAL